MRALSKIELSDDLRRLGLEKGDVVMVHTSLKKLDMYVGALKQ